MRPERGTKSRNSASVHSKAENDLLRHLQITQEILPSVAEKSIHELRVQNQELRERQQEIEEARKRYLDLYDFAPIGYFIFDQKGTIVDNQHLERERPSVSPGLSHTTLH